jgi:hypothetical protein
MTMENPKIELAPEDNARLARLYEEIRGRVEDLSLLISQITASSQGAQQPAKTTAYTVILTNQPKSLESEPLAHLAVLYRDAGVDDEMICVEAVNGCGCYNYTQGTFYAGR